MASNNLWVSIKRPVSVWDKPLKADFKSLFKSLSKAVIHGVAGKWDNLASDAVDALAAVGFEKDPGQLAWLLIRRALTQATFDLAKEHADSLAHKPPPTPDELCDQLDLSLEQSELVIDKALFERPAELPILDAFKVPFEQWLAGYGLAEVQTRIIAARLPSYFVFALNHEWRRRPQVYAPIKETIEAPFTKAGEREQAWIYYSSWLQKQINESMLNEAFSLKQIYVPLRAYYEQEIENDGSSDRILLRERNTKRIVIELEKELDAWVGRADKNDAIRVISGGPGCGKSSFAKIYAAHQAANSLLRVLYIPLHQFDPKADLKTGVGEFIKFTRLLPHNPLDPETGEPRLLIIFDGVDELAMQGKVGTELARGFIEEVDKTVNLRNYQEIRLQALITGREVVVQANVGKFRKEGEVLYILPYYLPEL